MAWERSGRAARPPRANLLAVLGVQGAGEGWVYIEGDAEMSEEIIVAEVIRLRKILNYAYRWAASSEESNPLAFNDPIVKKPTEVIGEGFISLDNLEAAFKK